MADWLNSKTMKTWVKEFCDKKNITPSWSPSIECYPGVSPPTFKSCVSITVDGETYEGFLHFLPFQKHRVAYIVTEICFYKLKPKANQKRMLSMKQHGFS